MIVMDNVYLEKSLEDMAFRAKSIWEEKAWDVLVKRDVFTVALSGGKTPCWLFQALVENKDHLPWEKTCIFQVDERYVSHYHHASNFRMINESLLIKVPVLRSNIFSIPVDYKNIEAASREYEKTLISFFADSGKMIRFDLTVLGMGIDGHTASIFPGEAAEREKQRNVCSVFLDDIKENRITVTFPVINNSAVILVMIAGSSKAETVKKLFNDKEWDSPVQKLNPVDGKIYYILDKDAAALL